MTAVVRPTVVSSKIVDSTGANTVAVDSSGKVPITASALPLPSGAATATLQGGGLPAALGAGGGLKVDSSGTALSVSEPGLSGGILTTWTAVLATATPIPATPLDGRGCLLIQAWEGNALPIFIGNGSVTARVSGATPASTDGFYLLAGQSCQISLAAAVALYARATATGNYVGTAEVAA